VEDGVQTFGATAFGLLKARLTGQIHAKIQ